MSKDKKVKKHIYAKYKKNHSDKYAYKQVSRYMRYREKKKKHNRNRVRYEV